MNYTIKERADYFQVFATKRMVTETTIKDGVATTEGMSYATFFGISSDPSIFDAEYDGNGWWTIDLDCGATRWRGKQPTKEVREALRKLGFDTKTITALFTKYTTELDKEPSR